MSYDKSVYKMAIEAARDASATSLQIGEIDWFEKGGDKRTATAIYSGNDIQTSGYYYAEGALNLGASTAAKKWLTRVVVADVIFTFPRNTLMSHANFFTANDDGASDPRNWRWYHLHKDLTWYEIASHQDVSATTNRLAFMGEFFVDRQPKCACMSSYGFGF